MGAFLLSAVVLSAMQSGSDADVEAIRAMRLTLESAIESGASTRSSKSWVTTFP